MIRFAGLLYPPDGIEDGSPRDSRGGAAAVYGDNRDSWPPDARALRLLDKWQKEQRRRAQ